MSDTHEPTASAEALRVMSSLIRSSPPIEASLIDDRLILDVACGLASESDETAVFRLATQSPATRARLTALRRRALELAKTPSAADPESSEDMTLLGRLGTRVSRMLSAAQETHLPITWRQLIEGNRSAASVLVGSICAALTTARAHNMFALTRQETSEVTVIEEGVTARLAVRLTEKELVVDVALEGDLDSVIGRSLVFSLADPSGDALPLHSSPIEGPEWKATLPEFAAVAGLQETQISPASFRVSIAGEAKLAAPKRLLFVAIPPELRRDGHATFSVELGAPPAIVRGSLALEFELPGAFVDTYADSYLEIVVGSGSNSVQVGGYSLRGWPPGLRRLEIPILGVAEGQIEYGSVIQLRLRSSA